jgi:hypothetical protein
MSPGMQELVRRVLPCVLSLSVLAVFSVAAEAADPQWYAELYSHNPNYVDVVIDTHPMESNVLLRDVTVSIEFYDNSGRLLGVERFAFTDAQTGPLESGSRYRRFFPHSYSQSSSAKGAELAAPGGGKYEDPDEKAEMIFRSKAGKRIQDASAAKRLGPTPEKKGRPKSGLLRTAFRLPGDGETHENKQIGPFCCTGETAIVRRSDGQPVAYIHFYSSKGRAQNVRGVMVVPELEIGLSSLRSIADLQSGHQLGVVSFPASELVAGASRVASVGGLHFKVSVQAAKHQTVDGKTNVEVPSVVLTVSVAPSR